jgi:hypothetical protein
VFRAFCVAVPLALALQTAAMAQEGWDCANGVCIEAEAQLARSLQGSFAVGVGISPEAQIDRFAALEQQRWLELRLEVTEPTLVESVFDVADPATPANWPEDLGIPQPTLSILVSSDAETYARLDPGAVVQPGSFLSVLIGQGTVVSPDGLVHFFPSDWSLSIASRRVLPVANVASSAPGLVAIVPSGAGIALGCDSLGCGYDENPTVDSIDVTGVPDPDPKPTNAPDAPARLVADDLARELQTELARVGCYTGAIDGLWGPNSRRSVAAFNSATGKSIEAQTPTPSALVAVARQSETACAPN